MALATCQGWHGRQRQNKCLSCGVQSTCSDGRSRVGDVETTKFKQRKGLNVKPPTMEGCEKWKIYFPPTMEASNSVWAFEKTQEFSLGFWKDPGGTFFSGSCGEAYCHHSWKTACHASKWVRLKPSYVSLPEGREKATPFLEKSQLINCFCARLSRLASATVACADLLICKWQPTQNLPYACTKKDILNWTGFWFDDVWHFHQLGGYSSKKMQPKLDASKQQMTMTIHFWVQHFVTFGVAIPLFINAAMGGVASEEAWKGGVCLIKTGCIHKEKHRQTQP